MGGAKLLDNLLASQESPGPDPGTIDWWFSFASPMKMVGALDLLSSIELPKTGELPKNGESHKNGELHKKFELRKNGEFELRKNSEFELPKNDEVEELPRMMMLKSCPWL